MDLLVAMAIAFMIHGCVTISVTALTDPMRPIVVMKSTQNFTQ